MAQFGKVRYREIYPGVDLVFYGRGRELEFDFIVAPGADPNQIRLELEGTDNSTLDPSGNLVLQTTAGPLRLRKPLVYQETDGVREEITSRFALYAIEPQSGIGPRQPGTRFPSCQIRYEPGARDRSAFRVHRGVRGRMRDEAFGVATGPGGNIYLTGSTSSMDFLTTADAEQGSLHDDIDAFFATLTRDGTLLSATYFGGSGKDEGLAIAVDRYAIGFFAGYYSIAGFGGREFVTASIRGQW